MMPGAIPRWWKTTGIESTPRPICVFIMRIAVPNQPSYAHTSETSCKTTSWHGDGNAYSAIIRSSLLDVTKDSIFGRRVLFQILNFANIVGHGRCKVVVDLFLFAGEHRECVELAFLQGYVVWSSRVEGHARATLCESDNVVK